MEAHKLALPADDVLIRHQVHAIACGRHDVDGPQQNRGRSSRTGANRPIQPDYGLVISTAILLVDALDQAEDEAVQLSDVTAAGPAAGKTNLEATERLT